MKIEKSPSTRMSCGILIGLSFLLPSACSDSSQQIAPSSFDAVTETADWVTLLDALYEDVGVIVQKGSSIQEALDAAGPGDVIYVEPGLYPEEITINKPGIKLIGLSRADAEKIVIGKAGAGRAGIALTGAGRDAAIINIQHNDIADKQSRRPVVESHKKRNFQIERTVLTSDIVHYAFNLRVGDKPFEVVRLHRVVREQKPFKPVDTQGAVFMLHGASLNFQSIFLQAGATTVSSETSAAVYLAEKNIDVWGMDFAWTLVPTETTDFAFMADWGIERDVDHTLASVSVARLIRGLSGQGFGKLNLLGYSYGVGVAYAAAGRETQQHPVLRDVNGIVAVDQVLKYESTEVDNLDKACTAANAVLQQIKNGVYHSSGGQTFGIFSQAASDNSDGDSRLVPNATNYQAALFVGTTTFILQNQATASWHFVGGDFSTGTFPIPTGLLYSDPWRWIGLLGSLPPYQPQLTTYEARACMCDEVDVSMDDHLGEITVPILYLGAGGAFGMLGNYTSTLTSSEDITSHTITIQPGNPIADFGHGDLFIGHDAPDLVWNVLHQWLVTHRASFM